MDMESSYPNELYSDDDLDFFMNLEIEHKKSLPNYSFYQLIELFPTAKTNAKWWLKEKVKELKNKVKKLGNYREKYISDFIDKVDDMVTQQIMREDLEKTILEDYEEYTRQINLFVSQINFLEKEIKKEKLKKIIKGNREDKEVAIKILQKIEESGKEKISAEKIARAKQFRISDFVKVKSGKTICLFHQDKKPSMHIYKNNTYHCFTCLAHGSVIDIVMQQNNINFSQAVNKLLNL